MAKQGAPLKPGYEAYKAAGIAVLGLAMLVAPGLGNPDEEFGVNTTLTLLAWAWSRPLGVVFLAAGLIGMYAMYQTSGKTDRDATAVAS